VLGLELISIYRQSARRWPYKSSPAVGCRYFPPDLSECVTFPVEERHRPLTGTKLYCQRHIGVNNLPKVVSCYSVFTGENWTHDLIIASPSLYGKCLTSQHSRGVDHGAWVGPGPPKFYMDGPKHIMGPSRSYWPWRLDWACLLQMLYVWFLCYFFDTAIFPDNFEIIVTKCVSHVKNCENNVCGWGSAPGSFPHNPPFWISACYALQVESSM